MDANLLGAFHVLRTFLSDLVRAGSGHVVTISSVMGLMTAPQACKFCPFRPCGPKPVYVSSADDPSRLLRLQSRPDRSPLYSPTRTRPLLFLPRGPHHPGPARLDPHTPLLAHPLSHEPAVPLPRPASAARGCCRDDHERSRGPGRPHDPLARLHKLFARARAGRGASAELAEGGDRVVQRSKGGDEGVWTQAKCGGQVESRAARRDGAG